MKVCGYQLNILLVLFLFAALWSQDYGDLSAFDVALDSQKIQAEQRTRDSIDLENRIMTAYDMSTGTDTVSEVYVMPGTAVFNQISELQSGIDSVKYLIGRNRYGEILLSMHFSDWRDYMDHLRKYNLCRPDTLKKWAAGLEQTIIFEKQIDEALLGVTTGNTRGKIFAKIRMLTDRITKMNSYINYLERI